MEEKSLEQMKRELQEFYFSKVKAHLSDINKIRKHERINTICALLFLIGFTQVYFCLAFSLLQNLS